MCQTDKDLCPKYYVYQKLSGYRKSTEKKSMNMYWYSCSIMLSQPPGKYSTMWTLVTGMPELPSFHFFFAAVHYLHKEKDVSDNGNCT
jgi:hypothetical protein